ncbi:hypothetical protein [Streptomyces sp. NBC_01190]|uniref:hypothetical protein n=1 Tax=Streptomyces sp. NBC_01190 TaxID=2903767 RepID=UPI0038661399|nr:hypothetical protein OG519_10585 [Streptomyces sp. NBC_01190]
MIELIKLVELIRLIERRHGESTTTAALSRARSRPVTFRSHPEMSSSPAMPGLPVPLRTALVRPGVELSIAPRLTAQPGQE